MEVSFVSLQIRKQENFRSSAPYLSIGLFSDLNLDQKNGPYSLRVEWPPPKGLMGVRVPLWTHFLLFLQ
jgi:hypothetical protein